MDSLLDQMHAAFVRQNRLLVATVAASMIVHMLAITLLPGARHFHEPIRRVLEVILVKPPVPLPVAETPPPKKEMAHAREAPKAMRHVREEPRPRTAPLPQSQPEQKQVLAIPESTQPAPNAFSVPQPVEQATPAAPPAEQKPAVTATAPAARETLPTTPPNFNAAYLHNSPPRYPLIARRNGVEGTVKLKVLVTREGRAAQVMLEQSSGSSALDTAARDAVRDWQFVPARKGQEPTESWVVVPVVFKLEGTS